MKRLECTKCRELQHLCKCDRKTIDFVDLEPRPNDPEFRANTRTGKWADYYGPVDTAD